VSFFALPFATVLYLQNRYSYVPGDQAGLIALYGGPTGFVKRLDYLHNQNITYIGNEVLITPDILRLSY
jgi:putative alpha-1,2-mannosidase